MSMPTTYPGVYIKEFTPGAPIQGVGTSTAAFLGPCNSGVPNAPTMLTSWDAFKRSFGDQPVDHFYLWYAVRGYFENGGTVCYVVRVSNATYDSLVLEDRAAPPQPTVLVRARELGPSSPQLNVAVSDDHAVSGTLFHPSATASTAAQTTITLPAPDVAAQFRPGDTLTWNGIQPVDTPVVATVDGPLVRLMSPLSTTYSNVTVRLADLAPGDTSFRMQVAANAAMPAAGRVVTITQGTTTATGVVGAVVIERISPTLTTYRVTLRGPLGTSFPLSTAATVQSSEFTLTVTQTGVPAQVYGGLGMDPEHPRYFPRVVNSSTGPVEAYPVEPPNTTAPPTNMPAVIAATALAGGTADAPANLQATDYTDAVQRLAPLRDVNQVLVPDRTDLQVQLAVIDHCVLLQDRFAVLDSRRGADPFGTAGVEGQIGAVKETKGYGALYYPWLLVPAVKGPDPILVPPSGHVAGIFARTDTHRGVHKAPAGNEAGVSGALGVERTLTDIDQGVLNLAGVNVVRVFSPGARPVMWGARTTATGIDSNWQYVNIRRLFIFLEQSLEEGLRWVVFEPNNPGLWLKIKRTATEFLTRAWRSGALFGGTAEEAFYVRIDDALNPFSEQALGRLNIEIGVRPSYPAEFVIVNIGIWPGGSEISEG